MGASLKGFFHSVIVFPDWVADRMPPWWREPRFSPESENQLLSLLCDSPSLSGLASMQIQGGIWRSSGSRGATWRGERVARKTFLGKMADPTNICWESGMEREMGPHQSLWILAFYSPGGGCFCGHSVVSHPLRGMESLSLCPMPLVNTFLKSFVLFFSRNTWSSHEHTI